MIEIFDHCGIDFKAIKIFEGWKIGLLRYSERFSDFKVLERHLLTDEAFVLLSGYATLYIRDDNGDISKYVMDTGKVYNVPKKIWHHIVVSRDALVMVVENSNTAAENTEKEFINVDC